MANREYRGRQKIPIRRIENQEDRYATFSKRRLSLYKKASELSIVCNVDVGIIIFSPTNHPYSFFSPTMESVFDRYMNPNAPRSDFARIIDYHGEGRINELNQRLNEAILQHEEATRLIKELAEKDNARDKLWWEEIPIEEMNQEQVRELRALFQDIHSRISNRIEQLNNGASTSSSALPENLGSAVGPSNEGNLNP